MRIAIFIFTLCVFISTFQYGLYEYKNNSKTGGISIFIVDIIMIISTTIMIYLR